MFPYKKNIFSFWLYIIQNGNCFWQKEIFFVSSIYIPEKYENFSYQKKKIFSKFRISFRIGKKNVPLLVKAITIPYLYRNFFQKFSYSLLHDKMTPTIIRIFKWIIFHTTYMHFVTLYDRFFFYIFMYILLLRILKQKTLKSIWKEKDFISNF